MTRPEWASGRSAQRGVVVGGEDQHLVDPAGRGLGEDRAQVGDDHRGVAVEGRVQVGDDPDQPLAAGP